MNKQNNWNTEKNELKRLNIDELNEKLQQLQKQKMTLESHMYRNNGSSVLTRNYPVQKQIKPYGNIKKIKKTIAFIKTILTIKAKK